MTIRERWAALERREKGLAIFASLYLVYALLGYFVLSPIIRDEIRAGLAEATGREVRLAEFTFNPLGLAVTASDFALLDDDGSEFIAFDRFYADFELSSLLRWSWHFDVIELDRPRILVTQLDAEHFNFDDLIPEPDTEPEASASGPAVPPPFSIGELLLTEGDFRFRDRSRAETQELVLDQLSFEVLDFSTRSDGEDGNQYALTIASPDGGRFEWSGRLVFDPLVVDGQLALAGLELGPLAEFYSDRLKFELPDGELELATRYHVDASGEAPLVRLEEGEITLTDLRFREQGREEDAVAFPQIRLQGIQADTAKRSVSARELALLAPRVLARMTGDGLDLADLFVPRPVEDAAGAAEAQAQNTPEQDALAAAEAEGEPARNAQAAPGQPEADDAGQPAPATAEMPAQDTDWQFALGALRIEQADLRYRDETLDEVGEAALTPLDLTLADLAWGDDRRFTLSLQAALNEQGSIRVDGGGTTQPLSADMAVVMDAIPLLAAEPWARSAARIDLVSGLAALNLDIRLSTEPDSGEALVQASGGASVTGLDVTEADGSPLARFEGLELNGLALDLSGRELVVEQVRLRRPELATRVDEQGRHVGDRITIPVAAPVQVGESPVWHYRIDRVDVSDGQIAFADRSLEPDFSIGLDQLAVSLTDVDTRSGQPSRLQVSAQVDQYAPLTVAGTAKLLADQPYADIKVALQGYDMTSLTPYTGRYVGYSVSQGQVSFDTRLTLEGSLLDSVTDLEADSFYLGDKVESDEAIKAPIKLGLAVLRNKDGLIRLPIKARGDLSDPSVSVSGIILKALGNVLVKAATSPFSVLAGLGGGESLESLAFEPGQATAGPGLDNSMNQLARLLADRPALDLQLAGSWDGRDREALAQADLLARVWRGDVWPGTGVAAQDAGFQRRVLAAYEQDTGADAETLVPADDREEAARRTEMAAQAYEALLARYRDSLDETRLQALAAQRAQNAKARLVADFNVDGARVFLLNAPFADREPVAGVQLGLTLD